MSPDDVTQPRWVDAAEELLPRLYALSAQGGPDAAPWTNTHAVIRGLLDELAHADRFGRGEFRVTEWAYEQALQCMREAHEGVKELQGQLQNAYASFRLCSAAGGSETGGNVAVDLADSVRRDDLLAEWLWSQYSGHIGEWERVAQTHRAYWIGAATTARTLAAQSGVFS